MAMCADRQVSQEAGRKSIYAQKILRMWSQTHGTLLLATSGDVDMCLQFEDNFIKAFKENTNIKCKNLKNVEAVVFYESGRIFIYNGTNLPFEVKDQYFGIGTGAPYALGALYHGASLKEAVRIACICDLYSGMGIQYESFKRKP